MNPFDGFTFLAWNLTPNINLNASLNSLITSTDILNKNEGHLTPTLLLINPLSIYPGFEHFDVIYLVWIDFL